MLAAQCFLTELYSCSFLLSATKKGMLNPHSPRNFLCFTVKVTNMGLERGRQPYTNKMQGFYSTLPLQL